MRFSIAFVCFAIRVLSLHAEYLLIPSTKTAVTGGKYFYDKDGVISNQDRFCDNQSNKESGLIPSYKVVNNYVPIINRHKRGIWDIWDKVISKAKKTVKKVASFIKTDNKKLGKESGVKELKKTKVGDKLKPDMQEKKVAKIKAKAKKTEVSERKKKIDAEIKAEALKKEAKLKAEAGKKAADKFNDALEKKEKAAAKLRADAKAKAAAKLKANALKEEAKAKAIAKSKDDALEKKAKAKAAAKLKANVLEKEAKAAAQLKVDALEKEAKAKAAAKLKADTLEKEAKVAAKLKADVLEKEAKAKAAAKLKAHALEKEAKAKAAAKLKADALEKEAKLKAEAENKAARKLVNEATEKAAKFKPKVRSKMTKSEEIEDMLQAEPIVNVFREQRPVEDFFEVKKKVTERGYVETTTINYEDFMIANEFRHHLTPRPEVNIILPIMKHLQKQANLSTRIKSYVLENVNKLSDEDIKSAVRQLVKLRRSTNVHLEKIVDILNKKLTRHDLDVIISQLEDVKGGDILKRVK